MSDKTIFTNFLPDIDIDEAKAVRKLWQIGDTTPPGEEPAPAYDLTNPNLHTGSAFPVIPAPELVVPEPPFELPQSIQDAITDDTPNGGQHDTTGDLDREGPYPAAALCDFEDPTCPVAGSMLIV